MDLLDVSSPSPSYVNKLVPEVLPPAWTTSYNLSLPTNQSLVTHRELCIITEVPSVQEYFHAVHIGGSLLLSLAVGAAFFICVLYADTCRHLTRHALSRTKSHAICVVSVYPLVTLATLCASVVPRAQLLAEALTQAVFTISWYQFYCLLIAYCGGEAALLAARPEILTPRVPPLCCFWPCMPQTWQINKRNLRIIRVLVLQLPIVQILLYAALLVAWAEQQTLAAAQQVIYVQPLMFISIFTGLWAMGMAVRMLAPRVLSGFFIREKMVVLQLVLIFSKLQGLGVRAVIWAGAMPCRPPLPPAVFGNLIYNILIMTEMVVLQLIAWRLYKRAIPKAPRDASVEELAPKSVPSLSAVVSEKVECKLPQNS